MKEKQLIIVGCQRSGTSALWDALRKHSEFQPINKLPNDFPINCEKELWHINDFFYGRSRSNSTNHKCHNHSIDNQFVENFFDFTSQFLKIHYGSQTGGWLYSHPEDGLFADEILNASPTVKLLFLIRHPQEVVWSSLHAPWEKKLKREDFLNRAKESAKHWCSLAEAHARAYYGKNQDRLLTIYNEKLRANPEDSLNEIYNFLNITPEPQVIRTLTGGLINSSFNTPYSELSKIGSQNRKIASDYEFSTIVTQICDKYMHIHDYSPLASEKGNKHISSHKTNSAHCISQNPNSSIDHENEIYWKKHVIWYKYELAKRREYIPAYLSQEIFLDSFFRNFALRFSNDTGKVLEFGFGFGRHLSYLKNISGFSFYGCDISPQALETAEGWADHNWRDQYLQLVEPRKPLPYPDKQFDAVYTVSVLIHINPNDITLIASELSRITQRFILHIENTLTKTTYQTSDMHNGCWAHPLIDIYERIGYKTHKLPPISSLHDIYLVDIGSQYNQPEFFDVLNSRLLHLENNYLTLQKKYNELEFDFQHTIDRLNNTRAAKFQHWLSTHPTIESSLVSCYDGLKHLNNLLTNKKSKIGTYNNQTTTFQLEINDPISNILVIYHPNWQGVRSASEGQSKNRLFLPELAEIDIQPTVDLIANLTQRTIIFNGFWQGYDLLMTSLKERFNNIHILYVHHGSLYQMKETREGPSVLNTIYNLYQKGIIDRIGFVKKGIPEAFCRLGGAAWYVMNYVEPEPNPLIKTLQHPIRVGIPVENSLRKNPHTQIVAALLIPEVDEVHLWHQPDISYLNSIGIDVQKIVVHSNCTREKTRDLLNQMTFTMYVTISECFPMVVLESFAAATPCFSGYTHGILDDMPELAKSLMIPYPDNPAAIANHIQEHLPNITVLSKQVLAAYSKISKDAQENIRQFADFSNQ